ncbi:acyltransferase [Alteromonas pelagimontana]|uniref:Acyltransferase n=1 Tax=Alteromonas pelagimontana TaxID=1858656 RepID=A0A6M4MHJ1_9ALTE|nr:acyltransferase family protein [Alteromonas pelagimontana]QJR79316.1 acyltransferase [Alteromonas pelagimontana]QJR82674.1 acyltransferase [Alteromonas pelagimontana]
MKYRSEIDGLRALAILPVVWMHAGLPGVSGGYLGVDVFFVISGFLITSIITTEIQQNSFSLLTFYERRARRILPALVAVIFATSAVIPVITVAPKTLLDYGASVVSVVVFASNFFFWQTSGYFGSASELSPMLHTWSLAVEEQYYIFFPLLAMLVLPQGKRLFIALLIVILLVSITLAQIMAVTAPIPNFYLLPSRAWELMAGALASFLITSNGVKNVKPLLANLLALAGMLMVMLSYLTFTPNTPHPSMLTAVPVAGVVLMLLFARQYNLAATILSVKAFTFIGLMSYSLYLWHQPVLALAKIYYGEHLSTSAKVGLIVLTFGVSALCWKYVESPFRNKQVYSRRRIFSLSAVSLSVVLLAGLLYQQNVSVRKLFQPHDMYRYELLQVAGESHSHQDMYEQACKFWSPEFSPAFIARFKECAKRFDQGIMILGGSHGMDLYNAVARNSENPFVVSVSRGSCRAHKYNGNPKDIPHCQYEDFKTFAQEYAENLSTVVYTQTPDRLFAHNDMFSSNSTEVLGEYIDQIVSYLDTLQKSYDLNVIMIGMLPPIKVPPFYWDYNVPLEQQAKSNVSANAVALVKTVDTLLRSKLAAKDITYVTKMDAFALNLPDDLIIDGNITYSDNRHLSTKGEEIFGKRLMTHLYKKGFADFKPVSQ